MGSVKSRPLHPPACGRVGLSGGGRPDTLLFWEGCAEQAASWRGSDLVFCFWHDSRRGGGVGRRGPTGDSRRQAAGILARRGGGAGVWLRHNTAQQATTLRGATRSERPNAVGGGHSSTRLATFNCAKAMQGGPHFGLGKPATELSVIRSAEPLR